jgi:hypothetical protein
MEILNGPTITTKPVRHCVGIRLVTPFRGMSAAGRPVRDLDVVDHGRRADGTLRDPHSSRIRAVGSRNDPWRGTEPY